MLILLISCSQYFLLLILDLGIEYPGILSLPIIMHNSIKTNDNHHVSPFVDTSCSHHGIFVHLLRAIGYSLLLGLVTLQTWPLTTLDMLVVLPIYYIISNANNFWCHWTTNQSQELGEWICIHIVPQIWFSVFDGSTFPYVWCCEWTCPGP